MWRREMDEESCMRNTGGAAMMTTATTKNMVMILVMVAVSVAGIPTAWWPQQRVAAQDPDRSVMARTWRLAWLYHLSERDATTPLEVVGTAESVTM